VDTTTWGAYFTGTKETEETREPPDLIFKSNLRFGPFPSNPRLRPQNLKGDCSSAESMTQFFFYTLPFLEPSSVRRKNGRHRLLHLGYFGIEQNERRMLDERDETEYNEIER
jgi:hypothetical protein